MRSKKHIDRIFQESFKDFEATPNPELWDKIQNEIVSEKQKPKATFPIWMRIASIAAVLALLITIGSVVLNDSNIPVSPDEQTVDAENKSDADLFNSNKTNTNSEESLTIKNALDNVGNSTNKTASNKALEAESTTIENTEQAKNTSVLAVENSNSNSEKQNNIPTNTSVATANNTTSRSSIANYQETTDASNKLAKTNQVAVTTNTIDSNLPNTVSNNVVSQALERTKNSDKDSALTADKTRVVASNSASTNSNNNATQNNNNTVAPTNNSPRETTTNIEQTRRISEENILKEKSLQNAIAWNTKSSNTPQNEKEKEENLMVGDSLISESPSIEDAIAQAENITEKDEDEKLVNRWQVQANIAPVYYNSIGKGSHIDEEFVSNPKSGETNTSYGVNVSYAISRKLAIRSGINSLNLSYDTDNVILYQSPTTNNPGGTNPLKNIDLASENQTLSAFSSDNLGFQKINNSLYNAAISQRLSYYEVPVEVEYKLVDNRFGVHIIGGMSTLFLDDNSVFSEFEDYKTYIGEANNVNSVSFSTNLGIGMNYKFTDKLLFNLEPTFKYQLNGFNNTSGNFNPYIIGVYTGFSYKF